MTELKISVMIKNVYGNETIYPLCDKAKAFCAIAKDKTLTPNTIKYVKQLGYTISVETDKVVL